MGKNWERARCIVCGSLLFGANYRNYNSKCGHCEGYDIEPLFKVCP